jgi:hypothetical protein
VRKNIAFAIALLLPFIIFATPQFSVGGYVPINDNFYIQAGINQLGVLCKNEIVYKITKIVNVPFFGEKKVIVPIKLGKNSLYVGYNNGLNLRDRLNLNLYEVVKANILSNLTWNKDINLEFSSFASYKNYKIFFSNVDSLVYFGIPFGISLKYSPELLLGITWVDDENNFLISINQKGIDTVLCYDFLTVFIDTIGNNIQVDLSIPLN